MVVFYHTPPAAMDEQFDERRLLDRETLRPLLERRDWPSVLRLALHYAAFVLLFVALIEFANRPAFALPLSIALAWVWCALFAPFHECTHGSAFSTPLANRLGAWLTSIPFLMAPIVYRTFHFEHHRHTQDPALDPELLGKTAGMRNPVGWRDWLALTSGLGMIRAKLLLARTFAFTPREQWAAVAPWWEHCKDPDALTRQCRILLGIWSITLVLLLFALPAGAWILFAWWLSNVFMQLWISAEHTGLPTSGAIVERTRSVTSNAFVRWWLWNMNYHAEHHAWPGMPWHALPAAHAMIEHRLEATSPGYLRFHRDLLGRA